MNEDSKKQSYNQTVPLSVIIITHNEAHNLPRCINSLSGLTDEIVVVDSYSTDGTEMIAQEMGARVYQHHFEGYGQQKSRALAYTSHDLVLELDADECVSDGLYQEIIKIKSGPQYDAYNVPVLGNYCGKWIRHCGWYPQPKIRLYNKTKGVYREDAVHEGFKVNDSSRVKQLKVNIEHYPFPTISSHLVKIERYTEAGAKWDFERGKHCSLIKMIVYPQFLFFKMFVIDRGFLDGYYGYIVCLNSAFAAFAKYAKLRELWKHKL